MANIVAVIKTTLFDDDTATHVVSFYGTEGQHVASKNLEGPSAEEVAAHLADHAPEGHSLSQCS